jgi:hypothetical protein
VGFSGTPVSFAGIGLAVSVIGGSVAEEDARWFCVSAATTPDEQPEEIWLTSIATNNQFIAIVVFIKFSFLGKWPRK